MKKLNNLLICLHCIFFFQCYSQPKVIVGEKQLVNAWAGGMNCPQFYNFQFNKNSYEDLVIFDREDNTLLYFSKQDALYQFNKNYIKFFPDSMTDWVIIRDYNCDGKPDIFTSNGPNIKVYQNIGIDFPAFKVAYNSLESIYYNQKLDVYSANVDKPAIIDIDKDGDLDLLVYDVSGSLIEWHKNYAQERNLPCGTWDLRLETPCWGHFLEEYDGVNFTLKLNQFCDNKNGKASHVGGSICVIDADFDGLYDVLIGDNGADNIVAAYNTGQVDSAHIGKVDILFPKSKPVNIASFPAGFILQLANGDSGLVFSPQVPFSSNDTASAWLYKIQNKQFEFVTEQFLQETMLDFGSLASVTAIDLNQDKINDLLVSANVYGNKNTFHALIAKNDKGFYYHLDTSHNINTIRHPFLNLRITHADINNDGIEDIIFGEARGGVYSFLGSDWGFTAPPIRLIDQQAFQLEASPALIDLDGDKDYDLLVGNIFGKVAFFENVGSVYNPVFQLKNREWEGIDATDADLKLLAYATLTIDNSNSSPDLLVANANGKIKRYNFVLEGNILYPRLRGNLSFEGKSDFGGRIAPLFATISDTLTLLIGSQRGGIEALPAKSIITNVKNEITPNNPLTIYPIPATHSLKVSGLAINKQYSYTILNCLGQVIQLESVIDTHNYKIPIQTLNNGLYILNIRDDNGIHTSIKFIVQK